MAEILSWERSAPDSKAIDTDTGGHLFAPWIASVPGEAARHFRPRAGNRLCTRASNSNARALDRALPACCGRRSSRTSYSIRWPMCRRLVEAGAPQAAKVLKKLIAYPARCVYRGCTNGTTLGQELELVRAYLEVMHMRMPIDWHSRCM